MFPAEAEQLFRPTTRYGLVLTAQSSGEAERGKKKRRGHLAEAGGEGDGLLGGGELSGVGVPGGLRHGGAGAESRGSGGGARVVGGEGGEEVVVVAGKIRGEAEARWAQRGGRAGGVERVRDGDGDEAHARRSHACVWVGAAARRCRCV